MSDYSDHFTESGLPALFDHMAEQIAYTPQGGETVSLSALLGPETAKPRDRQAGPNEHGRQKIVRRTLTIAIDPDGPYGGVAAPQMRATVLITVAGQELEYSVESLTAPQHGFAQLVVVRVLEQDHARPGFRGRR